MAHAIFDLMIQIEDCMCHDNPIKEDVEYVDSIIEDIRWLGFDWGDGLYYASDYFDKLYDIAVQLIKDGKAYVDSLSEEQIREYKGDYHRKGKETPDRNRPIEESLDLFAGMKAGKFPDGKYVLRAKIDLESPNMNMRDPIMYRIRHQEHQRTGKSWCIYPMYDYAHGQSDAIEGITHSLCSLEFQDHRPLYDWFTQAIGFPKPPKQIEFARLNLNYTVMSKRKLLELVEKKYVSGWNDPRMPTLSGLRRRGYTSKAIIKFCEKIGVAKADSVVDVALLEHTIREDLNQRCKRVMGVINPLKVVIKNFAEDETLDFDGPFYPEEPEKGTRKVSFTKVIYIEKDDFRENPPKKWFRLALGREVRLRYACLIKCVDVIKDKSTGEVTELICTWDPESKGGVSPDGRKVKGTLHWVSEKYGKKAEVRLYDRLFLTQNPLNVEEGGDFKDNINPDSLKVLSNCLIEPFLAESNPGEIFQFERLGYFCVDSVDSGKGSLVFNRTVTLRDSWAKIEKAQAAKKTKKKKAGKIEIKIDDFLKVDLRAGQIAEAALVKGADRLLHLIVDIGEEKPRQIFAGIRSAYPKPDSLVGKQVIVVANLKPRKMKFGISQGMVLVGSGKEDMFITAFDGKLKPGDKVS